MAEKDKTREELNALHVPNKLFKIYALVTLVLIPWTIWLSYRLPTFHKVRLWDITWGGFDVGLIIALALTAFWGLRKSGWVIVAASITGTFLLVDAWFDCLMSYPGIHFAISLFTAICFELPAAIVSYWVAFETGRRYFNKV